MVKFIGVSDQVKFIDVIYIYPQGCAGTPLASVGDPLRPSRVR